MELDVTAEVVEVRKEVDVEFAAPWLVEVLVVKFAPVVLVMFVEAVVETVLLLEVVFDVVVFETVICIVVLVNVPVDDPVVLPEVVFEKNTLVVLLVVLKGGSEVVMLPPEAPATWGAPAPKSPREATEDGSVTATAATIIAAIINVETMREYRLSKPTTRSLNSSSSQSKQPRRYCKPLAWSWGQSPLLSKPTAIQPKHNPLRAPPVRFPPHRIAPILGWTMQALEI